MHTPEILDKMAKEAETLATWLRNLAVMTRSEQADAPPRERDLAIVTGSRAYGTPRKDSDIDLVVLVSKEDLRLLDEVAPKTEFKFEQNSDGQRDISNGSYRFANLNLIAVVAPEDFDIWRDGTKFLKTKKPVSRERATQYLRAKRDKRKKKT